VGLQALVFKEGKCFVRPVTPLTLVTLS
jgi:hypothetical protein